MKARASAQAPVLWARIPECMLLDGVVTGPDGSGGSYGLIGAIAFDLTSGPLAAASRRLAAIGAP